MPGLPKVPAANSIDLGADGKIVGRTRMGSAPIVSPMTVGEDLLYVMNVKGDLRAFAARPGK